MSMEIVEMTVKCRVPRTRPKSTSSSCGAARKGSPSLPD